MHGLIHKLLFRRLHKPVVWERFRRVTVPDQVVDLTDAKVVNRVEEDDPHDVIRCVARACVMELQLNMGRSPAPAGHLQAEIAEMKSQLAAELGGTPTWCRYWSRHS